MYIYNFQILRLEIYILDIYVYYMVHVHFYSMYSSLFLFFELHFVLDNN